MDNKIKEILINKYLSAPKGWAKWLTAKANYNLQKALIEEYPFLDNMTERMYWLVNELTEFPKCPTCGKIITKFGKIRSLTGSSRFGYSTYCNNNCSAKNSNTIKKRKQTSLEKYGDETYNNPDKTTATCLNKYGSGRNNNKTKQTMLERYGIASYLNSDKVSKLRNNKEVQHKIQKAKYLHNTFNTSKPEEEYYQRLCEQYGIDNVKRQYKDDRYPFNCDFYIISEDLFIELNLFPTHYSEPFDPTNIQHLQLLEQCKNNPKNWVEEKLVEIWAGTDVEKYEYAKKNNLNYIRIYKED